LKWWDVQKLEAVMRVLIGICAISVVIPFASIRAQQSVTPGDRVRVSNCYPRFLRGRFRVVVFAAVLASLLFPAALRAQDFCIFPRRNPPCTITTVTEFSAMLEVSQDNDDLSRKALAGTFGLTFSPDPRYALSAMVSYVHHKAYNSASPYWLVKVRGRRRLSTSLTLDISPGLIVSGPEPRFLGTEPWTPGVLSHFAMVSTPALTVDAAVGVADWVGAFLRVDVLRYNTVLEQSSDMLLDGSRLHEEVVSESGSVVDLFVGARVGSYPGLALGALAPLVALVALILNPPEN
jgi:hypothetical protein